MITTSIFKARFENFTGLAKDFTPEIGPAFTDPNQDAEASDTGGLACNAPIIRNGYLTQLGQLNADIAAFTGKTSYNIDLSGIEYGLPGDGWGFQFGPNSNNGWFIAYNVADNGAFELWKIQNGEWTLANSTAYASNPGGYWIHAEVREGSLTATLTDIANGTTISMSYTLDTSYEGGFASLYSAAKILIRFFEIQV